MKTMPLLFTLLAITSLMVVSCGEVDITNLDPAQFPDQSSNPISFSSDLVPQFQSTGCTACHGSISSENNLRVDLHSSITGTIFGQTTSRVDLVNPANSYILTYPNGGSHSGIPLPSGLSQDILSWITDGALDN